MQAMGLCHLAGVAEDTKHCLQLTVLNLTWCKEITDAGLGHIAEYCKQLTTLELSGRIKNHRRRAARSLATHCPRLTTLVKNKFIYTMVMILIVFFYLKKKKNKKCLYVRSENSSEGRQVRNEELEKVSSLLMFNLKRERGWLVLCSETDEGRAFQKRARTRGGSPHENVQDQFMRERERLTLDTLLRFHEHGIHTTSRLDSILSLIKAVPAGKTEFQWLVQSANDMFSAQNRSLLKPNVKYGERALCFNFFVLSCYRAITKPWLTRKVLHEFILKGGGDRKEPLSSSKKLSMQSFEHLCFLNQCGWWIGPSKSGSDQFSDFEFKRTVTTMLNFLKIDNSLDLKKHGQMPMDVKTQIEILLFNDDIECARFRALMFILLIEDESSRIARSKHNAQVTSTQRSKMTMIDRLRLHMHYSARAEVPYLFRVQFDMKTNR
jgi:hypothetical protein